LISSLIAFPPFVNCTYFLIILTIWQVFPNQDWIRHKNYRLEISHSLDPTAQRANNLEQGDIGIG